MLKFNNVKKMKLLVLFYSLPVNPGSFHCSKTPTTHSSLRTLDGTLFLKKSKVCSMENIFSISGSDLSNGLTRKTFYLMKIHTLISSKFNFTL
jgi:hypothetical protein